jgi:4-alpha-glucanotransferase
MTFYRASGVLVHPTSFPSRFGIGDLGPEANRFIDWIAGARQKIWQILPLGPVDKYGSPYAATSAFAGNPLLISPERLVDDGLVCAEDLDRAACTEADLGARVDYIQAFDAKSPLFERAYTNFKELGSTHPLRVAHAAFCRAESEWLDNHAMFMALSDANGTLEWREWTEYVTPGKRAVMDRQDPSRDAATALEDRIGFHQFLQFQFFRQWLSLRTYARERGIRIVGDLPIYVAPNSSDAWGNQSLFQLDDAGRPVAVAGVPPDYFSATGQLWGNPLYNWDAMKLHGYSWWRNRFRAILGLVDIVRIDHFRGIQAYWAVPAGEETAENGRWVLGPGAELLAALVAENEGRASIPDWEGDLPVIAEDLGLITPLVDDLRKEFGLPGMAVLQFAFGVEERFRPENIHPNTVAYTGTHDNDTTVGWFESDVRTDPDVLAQLQRYTPANPESIAWELIEMVWGTAARIAVAPLQDVLSLGTDARMNLPGAAAGNWSWRFGPEALTDEAQRRLGEVTRLSGRAFPSR